MKKKHRSDQMCRQRLTEKRNYRARQKRRRPPGCSHGHGTLDREIKSLQRKQSRLGGKVSGGWRIARAIEKRIEQLLSRKQKQC